MTVLAALMMAGLLCLSRAVCRNWLSPAVLYCASWTFCLAFAAALGSVVDGISSEAALVYLAAALTFLGGCLAGQRLPLFAVPAQVPVSWQVPRMGRVLECSLATAAMLTPFFLKEVLATGGYSALILHLREARAETVAASGQAVPFSLLSNLPIVPQVATLLAVYVHDGSVRSSSRIVFGALLWALLGTFDGSKIVALQIPFLLGCAFAIQRRKLSWPSVAALTTAFVAMFIAGIYLTNYGYLAALGDAVPLVDLLRQGAGYVTGGVVGFSKYLQHPEIVGISSSSLRVPMGMVNGLFVTLGARAPFDIGSLFSPFVTLGPEVEGNVYTSLYTYSSGVSVLGALVTQFAVGCTSGWLFRQLCLGRRWAYWIYPWVAYAAVMSTYAEHFFGSTQVALKWLLLAAMLVYLGTFGVRAAASPGLPSLAQSR